eukprot:TRINITY_DN7252_c0_g1_i1.p1 TRINITY_DN7252_c0_g1~~TRINITY_DN7252_c0_g1_i1.p1  ORF type:complete len:341 (-),score=129.50 TRINITY_DN7252_c0_g1_i1:68-1090(-)
MRGKDIWISIHGCAGAGKTTLIEMIKNQKESKDGKIKFNHFFFFEQISAVSMQNSSFGTNSFFYPLIYHSPVWLSLRNRIPFSLLSCWSILLLFSRLEFNHHSPSSSLLNSLSSSSLMNGILVGGALLSYGIACLGRMINSRILSSLWIFNLSNHSQSMELSSELSKQEDSEEESIQNFFWFDRSLVDCWAINSSGSATSSNPNLTQPLIDQTKRMSCSIILDTPMDLVWQNLYNRAKHHPDPTARNITKFLIAFPKLVETINETSQRVAVWDSAWGIPVFKLSQMNLEKKNGLVNWNDDSIASLINEIQRVSSVPKVEKEEEIEKLLSQVKEEQKGHYW